MNERKEGAINTAGVPVFLGQALLPLYWTCGLIDSGAIVIFAAATAALRQEHGDIILLQQYIRRLLMLLLLQQPEVNHAIGCLGDGNQGWSAAGCS